MNAALAALATPDPRGLGGLVALARGKELPLPLREVRVRADIAGDCCRTVIDQRYANPYDTAMEAIHILPLPPRAAVVEMELRAGDVVVRADCRARDEAEATFAAARSAGHRAALLTTERADIHTVRVTNLPAGAEITVRIVLVERLEASDGRMRWRFPTTLAPRYAPGTPTGHAGPGTHPDTDRVPDASRVTPPLLLGPGATLDLEVQVRGNVRSVESSLHLVKLSLDDGGVRVSPRGGATADRDFLLTWTTAAADRTEVRAFTDGAHTLVVIDPPGSTLPAALPRDAVFVVDISGSMGGIKMKAAKKALTGALHGLLPNDRFRILAFDDRLEQFRPGFTPYDEAALEAADAWVEALDARGGTEMLAPIRAALEGETPSGRVRTVLFITDGQALDEEQLVAAVANRRGAGRFFTLGIDTAVNESLLGRLARVGGGTCELATPRDDIAEVVARIEARFGMPLADGVVVSGGELGDDAPCALFLGRPVTALLRGAPAEVTVRATTAAGPWTAAAAPSRIDFPLGALWAQERVATLQDRLALRPFEEEAIRGEVLRIALEHHIASRYTAFVAVETSSLTPGPLVEVMQPSALPSEWDSAGAAGGHAPTADFLACASVAPPVDLAYAAAPSLPPRARAARRPAAGAGGSPAASPDRVLDRAAATLRRLVNRPPPEAEEHVEAAEDSWEESRAEASALAAPAPAAPALDTEPGAVLARTQSADGSFGGDVHRTASALLALVLLGNTRLVGLRKRTVLKAATWLGARSTDPHASVALAALARVERGDDAGRAAELRMLAEATPEGTILAGLLGKAAGTR